jgi:hypothetical protein
LTAAAEHLIPGHRAETHPGHPVNGAANGAARPRERVAAPRVPDYYEFEEASGVEPLGGGWITVAVVIGIMAALIALGGMVLSFRAVSTEMIPAFGRQWSWLVPIVVDLTVFVFSGVDLVLARMDMSHPLARWTVYGATAGTVYLNYNAAGTLPGRVAHVLMPSIWVVFIELMRHVVRRQTNLATGSRREPIPTSRWLVSPWPTLKLWRRMVLWRVNSYPKALAQEKARLGAIAAARDLHGRAWRLRISPLTRLQINLGEAGADDIYQSASSPARRAQRQARTRVPARAAEEDAAYAEYAEPAAYTEEPEEPPELQVEYREQQREPAEYTPRDTRAGVAPPRRPDAAAGRPRIPAPEPAFAAAAAHVLSARFAEPVATTITAAAPVPVTIPAGAGHRATARIDQLPARPGAAPANGSARNGAVPAQAPASAAESAMPERPAAPRPPAHAQPAPYPQPAPPPLRRSVRESEMLTAAREVERWRGQPSATRISRELGIGMTLATSLANALREEEGLAPAD